MEKVKKVLCAKMYHIDHDENKIIEKLIDETDAYNYVLKVIADLLTISNTRKFQLRSQNTQVISNILHKINSYYNEEAAATQEVIIQENNNVDPFYDNAKRLLKAEVEAKNKYESNLNIEITKGSLLQALIETDNGYYFILSKIEHKPYIDKEDMEKHYGLPYEKITLKCCTIEFDDELNIDVIKVSDTGSKIAQYWSDDFLELDVFKDNDDNTKKAFTEIDKALKRYVKSVSESDYIFLRQKLSGYFDNSTSFKNSEMVDHILGNYSPQVDKINIDILREKLEALPDKKQFDAYFEINKKIIEKKFNQQIEISNDMELNFKKDIPDLKQRIKSSTEDGIKLLKIYKINDQTYELFKDC